jgi:hypothetical protein
MTSDLALISEALKKTKRKKTALLLPAALFSIGGIASAPGLAIRLKPNHGRWTMTVVVVAVVVRHPKRPLLRPPVFFVLAVAHHSFELLSRRQMRLCVSVGLLTGHLEGWRKNSA